MPEPLLAASEGAGNGDGAGEESNASCGI